MIVYQQLTFIIRHCDLTIELKMILQFEIECVVVFLANNRILLYQFDQILRIPVVLSQLLLIFSLGFEI